MEIKKALTFRASSIGDSLMGKYVLENIHAAYPDAKLGLVVASRSAMIKDLLAAYPWIEVVEANRSSPQSILSLWKKFNGSDLTVMQYAGKVGGKFALMSKIAARALTRPGGLVGFADASSATRMLYDKVVPCPQNTAPTVLEHSALEAAGIPVSQSVPTLSFVPEPEVLSRFNLKENAYVVAHLFSGASARGLSPEKKRELVLALSQKLPRVQLVLSGTKSEREEASRMAADTGAVVVAGDTSVQELMNLMAHSKGVVSVDTGAAHIAAQLQKKLIVLVSCVGAHWWLPQQYGADVATIFNRSDLCQPVHEFKEYPVCINKIDSAAVAERAAELFV